MNKPKLANLFRNIARYVLLVLAVLIFLFALVSGADLDEGISGIIRNSPNALPWIILLIIVWIAWKKELLGGIIIILFGIAGAIFFSIWNDLFEFVFWLILGIIMLGGLFLLSWKLRR